MRMRATILTLLALAGGALRAQAPPPLPPGELDRLVTRIALYPDPLLA